MVNNPFASNSRLRKWTVMQKVKRNGFAIRNVSDHFRDDVAIVQKAVQNDCYAFIYASDRIKDDKPTAILACNMNGSMLIHVSRRLQNDPDVVLTAIQSSGSDVLKFTSTDLRSDLYFIETALTYDWRALQWADSKIKDNESLIMSVVSKTGSAIKFASERLKDTWRVAYMAVSNDGQALRHISDRLRNDIDIAKRAIKNNPYSCYYVGEKLRNSSQIVEAVVYEQPGALWICFGTDRTADPRCVVRALERAESYERRMPSDACYSVYFDGPKQQWMKPISRPMKLRLKQILNGDGKKGLHEIFPSNIDDIRRVWTQYESRVNLAIHSKWERAWLISQILNQTTAWEGSNDIRNHILSFTGEDLEGLSACEPLIRTLLRLRLPLHD